MYQYCFQPVINIVTWQERGKRKISHNSTLWTLKEEPISERLVLNMNLNWEILTPSWEIFNMLVPHWWEHFSTSHFAALTERWQGNESLTFTIKSNLVSIIYAKLYLEEVNESVLFVTSFLHQFRNYGFTRCIKKIN